MMLKSLRESHPLRCFFCAAVHTRSRPLDTNHRPRTGANYTDRQAQEARERLKARAARHDAAEARHAGRDISNRMPLPSLRSFDPAHAHPDSLPALQPRTIMMLAAALVALLAVGIFAFNCSHSSDEAAEEAEPVAVSEEAIEDAAVVEEEVVAFEATPAALDGVPAGANLQTFSLTGGDAPVLSGEQTDAIKKALDEAEAEGDVTFVFYNVENGQGICYDADTAVYGASSFKAPYALYVCETQVETGNVTLETPEAGTRGGDGSSYTGGSYPLYDIISSAIIYSDNNAFGSLRDDFDNLGYDEWATSLGLTDALYREDSWYPWYCSHSSARVWTEMYNYLQTDSDAAKMLAMLTANTEVSFIRDAIESTGATVQDKAGWCADDDPRWNAICDAGIVQIDGQTYILSLMTGMADCDQNRELYEKLAAAIFDARDTLA